MTTMEESRVAQPDDGIDMSEVAEEMTRDPLSNALFENAQLKVMVRRLHQRIAALEEQHSPAGPAS